MDDVDEEREYHGYFACERHFWLRSQVAQYCKRQNGGINYLYGHPLPAKQCAKQFRDIACDICDVLPGDEWSIRYTWSSGEFEEEYSQDFARVYQDKDSNLNIDEVSSKYDESKRACMHVGLEEMGYENPEDFFSSSR